MATSDGKPIAENVARLSPHRTHESSWLKSVLCGFGMHRWYRTEFGSIPPQTITFCLWCTKAKFHE